MVGTAGTVADCTQAEALIEGIEAEYLLAARGYDTNGVLAAARARGMVPVIPPKRSRKSPWGYDGVLYQTRYMVENGFCQLKEWCGDALCQENGVVPGDLPDTRFGAVGQSNLTTRPRVGRPGGKPVPVFDNRRGVLYDGMRAATLATGRGPRRLAT